MNHRSLIVLAYLGMLVAESRGQSWCPWDVTQAPRLPRGINEEQVRVELSRFIPADILLAELEISGDTVVVELSPGILNGLDEARLRNIFDYLRAAFFDYHEIRCIRLRCKGRPLWSYLKPARAIKSRPDIEVSRSSSQLESSRIPQGLSGKSITIGPSHGRVWDNSGEFWYWQRGEVCDAGEELMEGLLSIKLAQFLYQYLSQDEAVVHVCRQLDKSDCCHPAENMPWWKMAARYWLEHIGVPSWVWDGEGGDRGDDMRCRPLYADYQRTDIYISHHTNASGGTSTGTAIFRDTAMEHPEHVANSYALALNIQNNVVNAIRSTYDAGWLDRGVHDSAGAFVEIHIPDRPACLIELAFHDNCALDGVYLRDSFFCSLTQWAIYKGVCGYFGRMPTWDMYSCEYVSDTIPTQMYFDQSRSVDIIFRNRGVLWSDERDFKLGAVDDSDPFAATRHAITGEVGPGDTYTFTFMMTAPSVEGSYTTDWQMLREGIAWFGPVVLKDIYVWPSGVPGDFDGDFDVDQEDFVLFESCASGPAIPYTGDCSDADFDSDGDVDQDDFAIFQCCYSGENIAADPNCAD